MNKETEEMGKCRLIYIYIYIYIYYIESERERERDRDCFGSLCLFDVVD